VTRFEQQEHPFAIGNPVSTEAHSHPASASKFGELLPVSVRSEKTLTVSTHDKLLCSLPAFEVIYVSIAPELFKEAQDLFRRLFPVRPATHLKKLPVIGGQISPTIPKAELIVELVQDCYPSLLESDPVCDAVWLRKRVAEQKSLFSSEMPNEAV
jgi:hypothetical protein